MSIKIETTGPDGVSIPRYAEAHMRKLAVAAERSGMVATPIRLVLVAAPAVTTPYGKGVGFGLTMTGNHGVVIAVACLPPREMRTRSERLEYLTHTFAHELAHYEQHRDGRKLQERGVEVRARTIMRDLFGLTVAAPKQPRKARAKGGRK